MITTILYAVSALAVAFSAGYLVGAAVTYRTMSEAEPDFPISRAEADARLNHDAARVSAALHDGIAPGYPYPPRPTSEFDGPDNHAAAAGKVTFLHGRSGLE